MEEIIQEEVQEEVQEELIITFDEDYIKDQSEYQGEMMYLTNEEVDINNQILDQMVLQTQYEFTALCLIVLFFGIMLFRWAVNFLWKSY